MDINTIKELEVSGDQLEWVIDSIHTMRGWNSEMGRLWISNNKLKIQVDYVTEDDSFKISTWE